MQETIRNDTPFSLILNGAEDKLVLAPLEQRQMEEKELAGFDLSEAKRSNLVSHWKTIPSETGEKLLTLVWILGVFLAIAAATAAKTAPAWFTEADPQTHTLLLWQKYVWLAAGGLLGFTVIGAAIYLTRSFRLVVSFLSQLLSLAVILAIGAGVPAATVYYFGDGKALLEIPPSRALFARILQVSFIGAASLLPVLLFFLFDRYQLSTLRNRLYQDLFRLDRGLKTRAEIDTKYGPQIRETFGPEEQGRGRLTPGTRWPVLVCAFVVTMGWVAAFMPIGHLEAQAPDWRLFPEKSAMNFGFLGAYFFGVQLIARRYARGDLKPKAYSYITIRILTVVVLSWVLELITGSTSTATMLCAFLIGIVPDEFFTLIREQFRGRQAERIVPASEKHPLTKLEGIDLYDRARLEQEGIVNIESLAHHDLIHLVLETRIPVQRLVDWIDQAILYLHVVRDSDDSVRPRLREYGIRTTTDLLACWDAVTQRHEIDEFKKLLGPDNKPYRLELIRDALLDDEWLERIKDWRNISNRESKDVEAFPKTTDEMLNWAEALIARGREKDAVGWLEKMAKSSTDARPHLRLARLLARSSDATLRNAMLARNHARQAFKLGYDSLALLTELIPAAVEMGDTDNALQSCDRAIELVGEPGADKGKQELLKGLRKTKEQIQKKEAHTEPVVSS